MSARLVEFVALVGLCFCLGFIAVIGVHVDQETARVEWRPW